MRFVVFAVLFISSIIQVQAGTMYRCGNTYQDSPCANQQTSKAVGKTTSAQSQASAPDQIAKIDADCIKQGEIAKKISWMREVGKTAEDQLAVTQDTLTRQLIPVVYSTRGSSLQVKNSVEQACMQQKEKDRLAAQLDLEAQRLRSGGTLPADAAAAPKAKQAVAAEGKSSESTVAIKESQNKTKRCNEYAAELSSLAQAQRNGASASRMEDLKQREKQTRNDSRDLGC